MRKFLSCHHIYTLNCATNLTLSFYFKFRFPTMNILFRKFFACLFCWEITNWIFEIWICQQNQHEKHKKVEIFHVEEMKRFHSCLQVKKKRFFNHFNFKFLWLLQNTCFQFLCLCLPPGGLKLIRKTTLS